jgi:hypothetical protein
MKGLLVHGCYDKNTFRTLESLGVDYLGFDLRARSPNLITFTSLKEILPEVRSQQAVLVFENDKRETILSYLDLLKNTGNRFLLEFRDSKPKDFYESFSRPFIWYFTPDADWMGIISATNCAGIILPLKFQDLYHDLPHLWTLIEENDLRIWLHAESFTEAEFFKGKDNIQASLDLTSEIHSGPRTIDQSALKNLKFWRKINECPSGQ